MGLFGKLFEKKECAICGGEIGLLGNRKLADGNMCKNCAAKLSPWMTDRRAQTVEEIEKHLQERELNKEKVAEFHTTRVMGADTKVYLDEDKKWFIVTRFPKFAEHNPDVLEYSQVTGCELDVDEHKHEIKRKTEEGKEESYDPPRYEYSYDFNILIRVNHPWFSQIRFRVNPSSVEGRYSPDYREAERQSNEIRDTMLAMQQKTREEIVQEQAPKKAVICPFCKASTVPDEQGRCEYCRGPIV